MRRTFKKGTNLVFHIVGFVVILIVLIVLVFKLGFFNIKYLEVFANGLICTDSEQIKKTISIQGNNLFFLNTKKISDNILQNFTCVKSSTISQIFPNKIKVEIIGRTPAAMLLSLKDFHATTSAFVEEIATPGAKVLTDFHLIDQEGIIFAKVSDRLDIPNIFIDGDILSNKKIQGDLARNILKVINKVKEFGGDNQTSQIYNDSLIIFSIPKIIFNLNEDINTQIASLQLILEKAKIDDVKLEFIDLRFDKPIVKFAPKKN